MLDRMAVIEAHFQRTNSGYYFYPAVFGGGYSVTAQEREQILKEYRELIKRSDQGVFVHIIALNFVLLIGTMLLLDTSEWLTWAVVGSLLLVFFALQRARTRSAFAPIRGRKRDAPRRDYRTFDVAVGRARGKAGLMYAPLFLSMFLLFAVGGTDYPVIVRLLAAVFFGYGAYLTTRIAVRTWLANRGDSN